MDARSNSGATADASVDMRDARSRIVSVAETLFRQKGFARTSMDAIAALARISKRTLYAEFADKRMILETVLDGFIAGRFDAIASLSGESRNDMAALLSIVRGLAAAAADEEAAAMFRLLIGEASHLPALAERAHRQGLSQSLQLMRGPLENLGVEDSATAGRLIYDLVVLAPGHRLSMGVEDADITVERIVDIILSGAARR